MAARGSVRWMAWALAAVLVALLAWVGSGPWRTLEGIRQAVRTEDARGLARHVDFPALRESLRPQVRDRVLRATGIDAGAGPLEAFGASVAAGVAGGLVDAMVTPAGLGALMEGRKAWNRFGNVPPPARGDGATRPDPLPAPRVRFASPSRATATVALEDGGELVLELERRGLRWRLAGMQLPR